MKLITIIVAMILLAGCTAQEPKNSKLQDELKEVVMRNLDAWNSKNFSQLEETTHLESDVWRKIKESWEIEVEIEHFSKLKSISLVGTDGDFAFVRCLFETSDSIGNYEVDKIIVFRKSVDQWKIWDMSSLSLPNTRKSNQQVEPTGTTPVD